MARLDKGEFPLGKGWVDLDNAPDFEVNEEVSYIYTPRGGYGAYPVDAIVKRIGPKRILCELTGWDGTTAERWLDRSKLRRKPVVMASYDRGDCRIDLRRTTDRFQVVKENLDGGIDVLQTYATLDEASDAFAHYWRTPYLEPFVD